MATVQIELGLPAWVEFQILDAATSEPVLLVTKSQIRVFYKKFGYLTFTQLLPLVTVVDSNDPQPGENFVEIGFGVYAINFSAGELDTAETFTWVVIPDNPGSLDFAQFTQQFDIEPNTDVTSIVTSIETKVDTVQSDITTGFTDTDIDLTSIQTSLVALTATLDAVQTTVDDIEAAQSDGINVSFVD